MSLIVNHTIDINDVMTLGKSLHHFMTYRAFSIASLSDLARLLTDEAMVQWDKYGIELI